ncbi:tetratricopeptide repeat protein [Microvirga sp. 2YAF29]|uniref:tetratricopeptide repeat protein n=1 Tax=Microvirga sp. 2YAF29 TaxID=3233031 RepID=UPI003F99C8DD
MRFFVGLLTLSLSFVALPLSAQESTRPSEAPREQATPPRPRPTTIDDLFDRLAKAKSEPEAEGITSLIERRFQRSGSDTADLLLSRATEAFGKKDYPLAIELLDRVVTLQPNWAEAWYRRATVFYQIDDPVGAMADLSRALKIEPRHFNAWTGLGHIFMASDDKARALEAYRRVLKLNPKLSTVQTLVDRLGHDVDGQDL